MNNALRANTFTITIKTVIKHLLIWMLVAVLFIENLKGRKSRFSLF
jgi:hypothetical protein